MKHYSFQDKIDPKNTGAGTIVIAVKDKMGDFRHLIAERIAF